MYATIERFATHQAYIVGVIGEQVETGLDDELHLADPPLRSRNGSFESFEPVAEQHLEHLVVQRLFGWEVVQQARPTNADPGGDVVQRGSFVAALCEASHGLGDDQFTSGKYLTLLNSHGSSAYESAHH